MRARYEVFDTQPAWSPDGKHIIFVCHYLTIWDFETFPDPYHGPYVDPGSGRLTDICKLDLENHKRYRLTSNEIGDWGPEWSPDGQLIAFSSARDGASGVYIMEPNDPGHSTRLTTEGMESAWSPDGRQIVVSYTGSGDLLLVSIENGSSQQLTDSGERQDLSPVWSPDGQRIAFVRGTDIGIADDQVWTVNRDGSGLARLTEGEFFEWSPIWSPAGDQIAFGSKRDGKPDLYIADVDRSNLQRLTNDEAWERDISWSPDGKQIAFVHREQGQDSQIYVLDLESGVVTCFSENGFAPMWSPDGQWILFIRNEDLDRDGYPYHKLWIVSEDGHDLERLSQE